ncbi:hypothetical protein pb186bvf_001458 [Paramecium bursaria]
MIRQKTLNYLSYKSVDQKEFMPFIRERDDIGHLISPRLQKERKRKNNKNAHSATQIKTTLPDLSYLKQYLKTEQQIPDKIENFHVTLNCRYLNEHLQERRFKHQKLGNLLGQGSMQKYFQNPTYYDPNYDASKKKQATNIFISKTQQLQSITYRQPITKFEESPVKRKNSKLQFAHILKSIKSEVVQDQRKKFKFEANYISDISQCRQQIDQILEHGNEARERFQQFMRKDHK